jgi:hypothetical protein
MRILKGKKMATRIDDKDEKPFEEMCLHSRAKRGQTLVQAWTGYDSNTLDILWESARDTFSLTADHKDDNFDKTKPETYRFRRKHLYKSKHYFLVLMIFIHRYPQENSASDVLVTTRFNDPTNPSIIS